MADDLDEQDKIDFNILKRQLSEDASTVGLSQSGSPSSFYGEVWPLYLNIVFVDHYIFGDLIGSGSYAEVRECIDTRNLERCAVKIVNKEYLRRQAPTALDNQKQEIRLLRRLKHQNVIELKECLFKGPKIYIFLEFCTFVLHDLLVEQIDNKLCPSLSRNLFHQLVSGLSYLHSLGIVHRDIKPQNLLITNCGSLKIIDFGVSQILTMWTQSDACSNYEGSPLFQAPEVVSGQLEYAGFKVDVWSAGVTLFLMLFGRYPFDDESLLGLYDKILGQDLEVPKDPDMIQPKMLESLLRVMMIKEAANRASVEEVLQHPWLQIQCSSSELNELIDCSNLTYPDPHESSKHSMRDCYRSMTVLPYLHNHHFPYLPVMKSKRVSPSPAGSPFDGPSPSASAPSSPASFASNKSAQFNSSSALASASPHAVISDQPIEWGTEEHYNLLKLPLIRANRLRNSRSSRKHKSRLPSTGGRR